MSDLPAYNGANGNAAASQLRRRAAQWTEKADAIEAEIRDTEEAFTTALARQDELQVTRDRLARRSSTATRIPR